VFALIVGSIAYLAWQPYGAAMPLGVALPDVPRLVRYEDVEMEDSVIADNVMNGRLLELMGPQADGCPPLLRPWDAAAGSFSIKHPHQIDLVEASSEEFRKSGILATGTLPLGQSLGAIQYTFQDLKDNESDTEYVARFRHELDQKGATFLGPQETCEPNGYRFTTIEYRRVDESGMDRVHFLYIGPFGWRVLAIDFVTTPEYIEKGRKYARKIASTFKPGKRLIELMHESEGLANAGDGPEKSSDESRTQEADSES